MMELEDVMRAHGFVKNDRDQWIRPAKPRSLEYRSLLSQFEDLGAVVARSEKTIQAQYQQLDKYQAANQELRADNDALRAKFHGQETVIRDLLTQLRRLGARYTKLTDQLADVKAAVADE